MVVTVAESGTGGAPSVGSRMCGGWRPVCGGDGAVPLEKVSRVPGHFNTATVLST